MNTPRRHVVIMPATPPRKVLMAIAGYPLILAASDELQARAIYLIIRRELKSINEADRRGTR